MTDSSSYSSLMALVDSHLSKTRVQESKSEGGSSVRDPFPMPNLRNIQNSSMSETSLPFGQGQRKPIPSLGISQSPIQSILAQQVENMLKTREKRRLEKEKEEERKRLENEMKKLNIQDTEDYVIDLVKALQTQWVPTGPIKESLSSSSSSESLFEPKFIDCDDIPAETPEPLLPCTTDMSYILQQKVWKGKCSAFGKVLTSRLRPIAAPYIKERIKTDIVGFDFSTPSPCDVMKAKLRKPTCNATYVPDILNFF